jgi:hypothetical protein
MGDGRSAMARSLAHLRLALGTIQPSRGLFFGPQSA